MPAIFELGDSLSAKIQEGLTKCYALIIVLSPEALTRPWVNEEPRAAYALRLAGDFKIFPVLQKGCFLRSSPPTASPIFVTRIATKSSSLFSSAPSRTLSAEREKN